jgi:hypothetical protein
MHSLPYGPPQWRINKDKKNPNDQDLNKKEKWGVFSEGLKGTQQQRI